MIPEPLVLSDGWPDGPPEERVHVAVEAAPLGFPTTILAAARAVLDSYVDALHDDDLELVVTGDRAWFRRAPCSVCDGAGDEPDWRWHYGDELADLAVEGRLEGPAPACESCAGTGEQQDGDEGYAYRECDQLDEGAVEFWVLEVRERSPA